MGEYPPLSDEEIMAISLCRARLENARPTDSAIIAAEFFGQSASAGI